MTHILVTNDDGVQAPGIFALADAMRSLGDITVVAPAINQSTSGHKKTLRSDIPVEETELRDGTPALAVSGSPADCIALVALGMAPWPPSLVVSGINRGGNLGQDITYSGTVTAALEATINGAPSIAISLDKRDADHVEDYLVAAQLAVRVAAQVLERGLPPLTILNLNVPAREHVTAIRLARQGVRIYRDELEKDGNVYRMVGPEPIGIIDEVGTDLWALDQGFASLTPIHLDMTAHHFMANLANWDLSVS